MRTRLLVLALLAAVIPSVSGCAASSDYLRPNPGYKPGQPAEGRAEVVFLRPGGFAKGVGITIIDDQANFIGESVPYSHFAVQMPPGERVFIAWGEGTHALKVNLAPGKTYYVKVVPVMGVWQARFHLKAIKQGNEHWPHLEEWLAETEPHNVLVEEGQAKIVERRKDTALEVIQKGTARFAEYTSAEADERTLMPDDGV